MRYDVGRFRRPMRRSTEGQLMSLISLGDGSTLTLDFTTGQLDPRLTFTRASGSGIPAGLGPTYIGSDGYVKYATVANTPRFDYDPTTLAPRGLLIEAQAANIAFYSQTINPNAAPWNVYWFVGGAGSSVTPVSEADPANTTTASRCVLGASGGRVYNGISTSAGVTYTLSFWAKSISGPTSLAFWHFNSVTGNSTSVTVTTSWQRYQVSILGRSGGGFVEFGIANNTGTAATVDLWGLQVETGVGASSYIPTGGSQGTRNEDSATMSSVASLGFDQYQGTFLIRAYQTKQGTPGSFARSMRLAGSTQEPMGFIVNGVTLFGTSRNASNTVIGEATQTNTLGQNFAFGFALDANDAAAAMRVSLNGSGTAVVRSATGPTQTATSFSLNTNATATAYASLAVRSIKFWPVAKTLAELNALTTGG